MAWGHLGARTLRSKERELAGPWELATMTSGQGPASCRGFHKHVPKDGLAFQRPLSGVIFLESSVACGGAGLPSLWKRSLWLWTHCLSASFLLSALQRPLLMLLPGGGAQEALSPTVLLPSTAAGTVPSASQASPAHAQLARPRPAPAPS